MEEEYQKFTELRIAIIETDNPYRKLDHVAEFQWWMEHSKDLPILFAIKAESYCVEATTSKTESMFSISGQIEKAKNNGQLRPEILAALTYIRYNIDSLAPVEFVAGFLDYINNNTMTTEKDREKYGGIMVDSMWRVLDNIDDRDSENRLVFN